MFFRLANIGTRIGTQTDMKFTDFLERSVQGWTKHWRKELRSVDESLSEFIGHVLFISLTHIHPLKIKISFLYLRGAFRLQINLKKIVDQGLPQHWRLVSHLSEPTSGRIKQGYILKFGLHCVHLHPHVGFYDSPRYFYICYEWIEILCVLVTGNFGGGVVNCHHYW